MLSRIVRCGRVGGFCTLVSLAVVSGAAVLMFTEVFGISETHSTNLTTDSLPSNLAHFQNRKDKPRPGNSAQVVYNESERPRDKTTPRQGNTDDNITQMAGFETIPAGPWDPPILDSSGIERMWLGLNFSISCNSTCRANLPMCNETEVLRCYGFPDSECNCSEKLLPTELKHMKHNSLPYGPHYAVLLAGQTRSFYSDFMLDFWKHFLDRFNDVALLAVLSKVSTQKVKDSGLAELKLNTKTNETIRKSFFKTRNLVASVISLNTSLWNVLVLNDACKWPVTAEAVQDPALRAMLSPPRNTDPKRSGGWSNGYRAKVIAFDLMLRMEAKIKQRFKHVLVLRPDVVTDLGQDPAFSASMINFMYFFNDVVAVFPRPYATWFFTHLATGRTLTGLGLAHDQDAWDSLIRRLLSRYSTNRTLLWPTAHAAFHGIPFCGGSLQAIPAIPCTPSVNTEIWFIRDQFKATGPENICVDTRHRERKKQLQIYLTTLGMNTSLIENIDLCDDTRNRSPRFKATPPWDI